jgi:hypothetical protein
MSFIPQIHGEFEGGKRAHASPGATTVQQVATVDVKIWWAYQ